MRTQLTPESRDEIVKMYRAGEKTAYIAALFKVSVGYVSYMCIRRGVPRRQVHRHRVKYGAISQEP